MTKRFTTYNQARKFIIENSTDEFRGTVGSTYKLTDGRTVKFIDRSNKNCWGIPTEATELVEVGQ